MPPELSSSVLMSLVGGGFAAAFLHAALPTHWLPFVLVGRAQRWGLGRTLAAVTTAGLAHIGTTALAGSLIVALGLALDSLIAGLLPWVSAALLLGLGLFYLSRALMRRPVAAGGLSLDIAEPAVPDRAAFWGLVAMMAVSPGEVLLPLYLAQAQAGVVVLSGLTLAFAAGTILGMAVFTLLARAGWSVLRMERWARYEGAVLGLALITLGLLVAVYRH